MGSCLIPILCSHILPKNHPPSTFNLLGQIYRHLLLGPSQHRRLLNRPSITAFLSFQRFIYRVGLLVAENVAIRLYNRIPVGFDSRNSLCPVGLKLQFLISSFQDGERSLSVKRFVLSAQEGADAAVDIGSPPEHRPGEASGFEGVEQILCSCGFLTGRVPKFLYNSDKHCPCHPIPILLTSQRLFLL